MTVFSNAANGTAITVTVAGLSTLANGAPSAPSTLVDNTTADAAGISYLTGWFRLTFSAALTAGAGTPSISLYLLPALDGSTLPNPPGASAVAPSPNAPQLITQLVPSVAFSVVDFGPAPLADFKYGVQVLNNSGVAFSGTVTLTFYPGGNVLGV